MGSLIRHITVDCRDHYALMQFWREALQDYHDHPDDPNKPEDEQSGLVPPPPRSLHWPHCGGKPDQARCGGSHRTVSSGATAGRERAW